MAEETSAPSSPALDETSRLVVPSSPSLESSVTSLTTPTSTFDSLVISIKSFQGTGFLALPFAFTQTGLVFGLAGVLLFAFITLHSINSLVRTMARSRGGAVTYGELASDVAGPVARVVVEVGLAITQLGLCCGYVVFLATTLGSLIPGVPTWRFVVALVPVLSLLVLLPSLHRMRTISRVAVALVITAAVTVVTFAIIGLVQTRGRGAWGATSSQGDGQFTVSAAASRVPLFRLTGLPIFLGILTSCWEGAGLVFSIRGEMEKPQEYGFVLTATVWYISVCYALVGALGYWAFGEHVHSSVPRSLPQTSAVVHLVEVSLVLMVIVTFTVQFYPVGVAIERSKTFLAIADSNSLSRVVLGRVMKVSLVIFVSLVALVTPHFGLVVSLVGSMGASVVSLVMPNVLFLISHKSEVQVGEALASALIIALGSGQALFGTLSSLYKIINET
jgi:proton-coupled amino acid transporter